ncbi:hypothetical protein K2O51_22875 [Cupriavidus pinatubonensis]|uniref:hypothetical protein n=1 Tax=Cupriavidus pinatubonensis TaxID=248026 RepID=UPI001C73CB8E|nr:hypothetical protein [Cupriavidus pinatubonensis]QYY30219.1 hypothetical protein K2O51_22875 [Cupriavidus pinatubonensis]
MRFQQQEEEAVRAVVLNERDYRGAVFIFICGLIFSLTYAIHSNNPGPPTRVEALATLQSFWPYKPRVLAAWIVYKLVGGEVAETVGFRFAYAFALWFPIVYLLSKFYERLGCPRSTQPLLIASFTLVMLAHYSLPNVFSPYYIYDTPALLFYLITVLLLCGNTPAQWIAGIICAGVFFVNRETIIIATVHAFAIRAAEVMAKRDFSAKALSILLPTVIAAIVALCVRAVLLKAWDGNAIDMVSGPMYEDGQLRIVANLKRIYTLWGDRQQLICIGFGFFLYLPFVWRFLPSKAKFTAAFSTILLVPTWILGNITEIRLYSEFLPLMTCALTICAGGLIRIDEARR